MTLYIIATLSLIWTVSHVTPWIPDDFMETYPNIKLKSYRLFAKNRTVEQNETHFRLPRVFDELVFECSSELPTKWNYFNQQAKNIEINKWRYYNSTGSRTSTGSQFYSTFKVALSNPNKMVNLSCENVCPKELKNCKHLNTFLRNTVAADISPGFFELQYGFGNRELRRKAQDFDRGVSVSPRLGWNTGCTYLLNVDMDTGAFACMKADGSEEEVPSMFIPCNNPDECDTVFFNNGDNCPSGKTFKRNCSSRICSELRDTSSLFVLACGDYNENSVARGFYKTLDDVQSGKKELHEYKGRVPKTIPYEDMVEVRLGSVNPAEMRYAKNKSIIYTHSLLDFECLALRSFFSHGFRWKVLKGNGTEIELGSGTETLDDVTQLYTSKKTIFFDSPLITAIVCEAPNWNELNMTNFTMHVSVAESVPPYFFEGNGKAIKKVQEKMVDVNSATLKLTCSRFGEPPALIEWHFDGIKPEASDGNGTLVQHYTVRDTDSKSEVIMKPNHPFTEVVCVAGNAAGEARLHYRITPDAESRMDIPIISGVVACALFLVIVVIIIAFYKIRKTQLGAYLSDGEIEEFFTGASGGHDAFVLPYDNKLELSRESFVTEDIVLGSGTYGKVLKGHIGFLDVAIKVTKSSSESLDYLKALLSEVKVMSYVGSHSNIVNLIGACTSNLQKNEIQVILEFCERGDMLSVLKKGRSKYIDLLDISSLGPNQKSPVVSELVSSNMILSTRHLVHWALDIIEAMEFISSKNIIHGDLAARNVLISHDLKAKISDFGLSKHMYSCAVYVKKSYVPLPTRWMAYESLKNLEFSKESDVWSLGVTLWEMFSLGLIPYDKYMWEFQSHSLLAEGIRLEKPIYASQHIYTLMCQTWNIDPRERPSYACLKEEFNKIFNSLQD